MLGPLSEDTRAATRCYSSVQLLPEKPDVEFVDHALKRPRFQTDLMVAADTGTLDGRDSPDGSLQHRPVATYY